VHGRRALPRPQSTVHSPQSVPVPHGGPGATVCSQAIDTIDDELHPVPVPSHLHTPLSSSTSPPPARPARAHAHGSWCWRQRRGGYPRSGRAAGTPHLLQSHDSQRERSDGSARRRERGWWRERCCVRGHRRGRRGGAPAPAAGGCGGAVPPKNSSSIYRRAVSLKLRLRHRLPEAQRTAASFSCRSFSSPLATAAAAAAAAATATAAAAEAPAAADVTMAAACTCTCISLPSASASDVSDVSAACPRIRCAALSWIVATRAASFASRTSSASAVVGARAQAATA
jgi:hypothetical protein